MCFEGLDVIAEAPTLQLFIVACGTGLDGQLLRAWDVCQSPRGLLSKSCALVQWNLKCSIHVYVL